jgi:hypothetical protein
VILSVVEYEAEFERRAERQRLWATTRQGSFASLNPSLRPNASIPPFSDIVVPTSVYVITYLMAGLAMRKQGAHKPG